MKNITVIIGSPRKNGNTETLANAFIEGAKNAGNTVNVIKIYEKHINGCIGCNSCSRSDGHKCVFNDDMVECYRELADADVIVAATPIYFYGVSSQVKCLIDRLHNPIRKNFKVKKLGLLAVCADTRGMVFDSVNTMYKSILSYFSLEDGGIINVFGVERKGAIEENPSLLQAKEMGARI